MVLTMLVVYKYLKRLEQSDLEKTLSHLSSISYFSFAAGYGFVTPVEGLQYLDTHETVPFRQDADLRSINTCLDRCC